MAKALRDSTSMSDPASRRAGPWLPWAPRLILAALVAPVVAGLIGTALPAFDFFPALGGNHLGLEAWRRLFELPGIWTSVALSLMVGIGTTGIALGLVTLFCAAWSGTRLFAVAQRALAPLLAAPHLAVAFGVAFLLAPSGWILRLLSPWATGFERPPDWLIIHDPWGLSLMLGLIAKETPFLLLMALAALGQADARRSQMTFRTLGYRQVNGWMKVIFPRVYAQMRLPVFATLAFGLSVVDVAIILGPTTPPTLAARLLQLFNDPDLSLRFVASAGAMLQLALTIATIALWIGAERLVQRIGRRRVAAGYRGGAQWPVQFGTAVPIALLAAMVLAGSLAMIIWSFATYWRFPDPLPAGLTLANWTTNMDGLQEPLRNTLSIALSSTGLALVMAIGVLEFEIRSGKRSLASASGMLYLPLILPQIAFLFGVQTLLVLGRFDGQWPALVWTHLVFVYPYVFLALADPYRAWDHRYQCAALTLGAKPMRALLRVKLPMLLRPLATAGAVGFAVSVGQYLSTRFAGNGRFPTLTTEAVALSSGGDQRLIGVYALLQMSLPLIVFGAAIGAPAWRFRRRLGMRISQ